MQGNMADVADPNPVDSSYLDVLPNLLQLKIASIIREVSRTGFFNLCCCSQGCLSLCKESLCSTIVHASKLAESLMSLNNKPEFDRLTIMSTVLPAVTVSGTALLSLQIQLKALSFASSYYWKPPSSVPGLSLLSNFFRRGSAVEGTGEAKRAPEMKPRKKHTYAFVMEDLRMLIQPWYASLELLHLDHCKLQISEGVEPNNCSPFSILPRLLNLRLLSVCATTHTGEALTTLNLTGCLVLQELHTHSSSFPIIDASNCAALNVVDCHRCKMTRLVLTGCSNLLSLNCWYNRLSELILFGCARLKHLDCSHNNLRSVVIDQSARLLSLSCVGYYWPQCPEIIDGASVLDLTCSPSCLVWLREGDLLEIKRLQLHSSVHNDIAGFRDLKYLSCNFPSSGGGKIDLSHCSDVELFCRCKGRPFAITGPHAVIKMTLQQDSSSPVDLEGFTNMQQLCLTLQKQTSLELSRWSSIRRVDVTSSTCSLTSINLFECTYLDELICDGFPNLSSLDLCGCVRLKSLSLKNSGLAVLNIASCIFLTNLDVSHSCSLHKIYINQLSFLKHITCVGCDKRLSTLVVFM